MPDLKHLETRTQTVHIHYSDPTSTREWIVWRSRDRDEILAHLTNYNLPPIVDTVAGIPRYLRDAELTEAGNGVWKYRANYAKDPNTVTIEINYTGGQQKMLQSHGLVNSYSCDTEASSTTLAATEAAIEANDNLSAATTPLETSISDVVTAVATGFAYANDPGVSSNVYALVVQSLNKTLSAKNYANEVLSMAGLVEAAVTNAINAAQAGDSVLAASSAASAQDNYDTAAAANATIISEIADAQSLADDAADAAVITGVPEDEDAALLGAKVAANVAETSMAADANDLLGLIATAANAAQDIADALVADAAGGIPNFGTMINVTDKGVDGVEIEDEKCDITITKHFIVSALPTDYIRTLELMAPSKNGSEFTINYKGQIRVYQAGELKFKNFTYKQEGDNTIDVTYYLAFSRNITEADDLRIGNSPAIVKKGWDYLSVFYVSDVDQAAGCKSKKPKAAYVHKVYRDADFTQLQL